MKVLIVVPADKKDDVSTVTPVLYVRQMLKQLGYEIEFVAVQSTDSYITTTVAANTDDYAFVVIPRLVAGSLGGHAILDIFDYDIPVLVTVHGSDSDYQAKLGADTYGAAAYRKIDYPTVDDIYYYGGSMKVLAGHESYVTALGTDSSDSTQMCFWKRIETGKAPVYCFAGNPSTGLHHPLPIMINQAIKDGYISGSKLPTRKFTSMFDIDDLPDANNTLADLQNVIDVQNQYAWPISWGLKTGAAAQPGGGDIWNDGTITAAQKALIAANTPDQGGYVYTQSHNHNWHWDMSDAPVNTKAAMDTEYRADVARAVADGISMGNDAGGLDAWGYIYQPNNQVSDEMFQLGSPQTSVLSDPNNTTAQAGYGWKACRIFTDSQAGGYGRQFEVIGQRYHRGMLLLTGSFRIGSTDINYTVDSATEISEFANTFSRWLNECMGFNCVHFWHGANFYDGHSGGNAPALKVMRLIGAWAEWMSDIHEFIHPSTFVERLNVPIGNRISL